MIKNIFITGSKHAGKSTLVDDILETFKWDYAGYRTYPYEDVKIGKTYYLEDIVTHEREMISFYNGQCIQGIPETFSQLGVRCLKNALNLDDYVIVLDELGRFEQNSFDFILYVEKVLDSNHIVVAVIKDEPIAYLEKIKQREDYLLINLNQMSYDEAKQKIISEFYTYGGR